MPTIDEPNKAAKVNTMYAVYPQGEQWDSLSDLDAALLRKIAESFHRQESIAVLHKNETATIYRWLDGDDHFVLVAMTDGVLSFKMAAKVGEEIETLRSVRKTIEGGGGSDFALVDWLIENLPVGEQVSHANN